MGLNISYGSGQTSISDDEKLALIPYWVENNEDLNMVEQENISKAIIFYQNRKIKYEDILTISFVKSLHKKMFGNVWKWAGKFRKTDKNIGICKSQITVSTYNLLEDTQYWIENEIYDAAEVCIRCKHKMVAIHLFPNGNGRHSRLFADILLKSLAGKLFNWGKSFENPREKYLKSLREADMGSYQSLIFFAKN